MRGRLWLKYFLDSLREKEKTDYPANPDYAWEWTEFMYKVVDGVGERMDCYVARRRQDKKEESGEYMNIDALFIDNAEYVLIKEENKEWDPFVLPRAVVELENSFNVKKISYSLSVISG